MIQNFQFWSILSSTVFFRVIASKFGIYQVVSDKKILILWALSQKIIAQDTQIQFLCSLCQKIYNIL